PLPSLYTGFQQPHQAHRVNVFVQKEDERCEDIMRLELQSAGTDWTHLILQWSELWFNVPSLTCQRTRLVSRKEQQPPEPTTPLHVSGYHTPNQS
ncbi:hypothetical protein INR49_000484, partial [Caranx melampygus]